jgi:hypothetical protein
MVRFKQILLIAILLFTYIFSAKAVTYQIGSGVTTNTQRPLYTCYTYNYSQSIYTLAELNAAGASGAQLITNIRYFYATAGATPANFNNWTVYIGNTAQAALANATNWIPAASMTQVFNGIVTFPAVGNWVDITLSTPFLWDGTSNLVVAVDENAAGYSCTAAFRSYAGVGNRYMLYYSDPTNPDPNAPPTANLVPGATMPQIQFEMISAIACAGQPLAGTATASLLNACGLPFTLGLNGNTSGSGSSCKWLTCASYSANHLLQD